VQRLGANPFGEKLGPAQSLTAPWDCRSTSPWPPPCRPGTLLVVGPAALLDERVYQPDGRAVYAVPTATPTVIAGAGFAVGLAVKLRQWQDTDCARLGVDAGHSHVHVLAVRFNYSRWGLWESCTISCILLRHIDCMVITN
jgi:hypothetical protein